MNWRIIFVVVILGIFGSVVYLVASKRHQVQVPRATESPVDVNPEPEVPGPELTASNELAAVRQWVEQNPGQYDDAVRRYDEVAVKFGGTVSAATAKDLADKVREEKKAALLKTIDDLKLQVKALEEKGAFAEAIALMEKYSGPFMDESIDIRNAETERLRKLAGEAAKQQDNSLFRSAVDILLAEGVQKASAFVGEHEAEVSPADRSQTWQQLVDTLERAGRLGDTVQESFRRQKGELVTVELKGGRQSLQIAGADDGAILYLANVGGVRVTKRIALSQLSEEELVGRVGEDMPGLMLHRMASSATKKDFATARTFAEKLPSPLRESIAELLEGSATEGAANAAWNQLLTALFKAGVAVGDIKDDPAALLEALRNAERSAGMNLLLHAVAKDLALQYRETEWIKDKGVIRLINFMYELKPDEESSVEASDEESENTAGKDAKNIDWRKEIDF